MKSSLLNKTPSVSIESQPGRVEILSIDNDFGTAKVSLFGAHVLSFCPKHDNRERLWLSPKATLDGSTSIRGGVPVCWPWFGGYRDKQYQSHGYVRTQLWQLEGCSEIEGETKLTLSPTSAVGAGFAGKAKLTLEITIGKQLELALVCQNVGVESFEYTCALHSYFKVKNIDETELLGLSGDYSDKTLNWAINPTPTPYLFQHETDRIHLNPVNQSTILCGNDKTVIYSTGHDSLVVWNPWQETAAAMDDMSELGYCNMLCVETAITQGRTLAPNAKHCLKQRF